MMANYTFQETSSRNITENGEQFRVVQFRGYDDSEDRNDRLDVNGVFTMPMMDYFQAGIDGNISEIIRNKVVEQLTTDEKVSTEDQQSTS